MARGQSCANHVQHIGRLSRQHAVFHVLRRESSTVKFDRAEIAFILALLHWLKLLTNEIGEGGGGGGGGAGIAQLVVLGFAVHSVAGSILLWGHFPVEGIFPLELTWVQTQKLFRMRL